MSESSVLEQPKIKVSKRPAIQNKVDEKTNQLRNLLPNTNDKTLNVLARKLTADEVRIERLREEARKVNIDSLTGLKNRKGFEQELRKVFSVAHIERKPLGKYFERIVCNLWVRKYEETIFKFWYKITSYNKGNIAYL